MSFLATLKFEEEDASMNVLDCSFEFYRDIDINGRPTSLARGGRVHVTIESSNNADFFAWITSADIYKSGEIIFYKRDMASSYKTLRFIDAICAQYREIFSNTGEIPMKTELVISAQEIDINDVAYANPWYNQT
ncbi:hypothetical protein J1N09_01755 [Aureitalea sp. L0-47]|uniref:type VI secretion system tube protein TssD n=1 Tax=Aureitalea sp. L0-47 TaxID=2816962 RepID=UPI0022381DC8|nr:type VI secretion system tube protein TssD [Aureitalea sp. L0-47]MCW5518546.1 hypothetical protein [Aureitalea sp. L0-47]